MHQTQTFGFCLECSRFQWINKREYKWAKIKDFTVGYDGSTDNEVNFHHIMQKYSSILLLIRIGRVNKIKVKFRIAYYNDRSNRSVTNDEYTVWVLGEYISRHSSNTFMRIILIKCRTVVFFLLSAHDHCFFCSLRSVSIQQI
jgi:hypothetical protein